MKTRRILGAGREMGRRLRQASHDACLRHYNTYSHLKGRPLEVHTSVARAVVAELLKTHDIVPRRETNGTVTDDMVLELAVRRYNRMRESEGGWPDWPAQTAEGREHLLRLARDDLNFVLRNVLLVEE